MPELVEPKPVPVPVVLPTKDFAEPVVRAPETGCKMPDPMPFVLQTLKGKNVQCLATLKDLPQEMIDKLLELGAPQVANYLKREG